MVEIQAIGVGHESRLRQLRLRALHDAPDTFGSTYADVAARPLADWTAQLEELETFVAVDDVDVGLVRGVADHDEPSRAWLISMWVAPQARGQDVGLALIDAVLAWAERCGFAELHLDVADDNSAAIALYQRAGFEPNGETSTLPPPREHIHEHRRVRRL